MVPSLLIPLTSPYQPIRHQALSCLNLLQHAPSLLLPDQRSSAYATNPALYLLDALIESEMALASDPSALRQLLGQMFPTEGEGETQIKRTSGYGTRSSPATSFIFASSARSAKTSISKTRHQTKKKMKYELRSKVAIRNAILSGILTHVVALSPPPHIQSSLLAILAEVDSVVSLVVHHNTCMYSD